MLWVEQWTKQSSFPHSRHIQSEEQTVNQWIHNASGSNKSYKEKRVRERAKRRSGSVTERDRIWHNSGMDFCLPASLPPSVLWRHRLSSRNCQPHQVSGARVVIVLFSWDQNWLNQPLCLTHAWQLIRSPSFHLNSSKDQVVTQMSELAMFKIIEVLWGLKYTGYYPFQINLFKYNYS